MGLRAWLLVLSGTWLTLMPSTWTAISAWDPALEVVTPTPIVADPGTVVSCTVRISEVADTLEVRERFTLPPLWESLFPSTSFVLPPGESTRLLAFRAPSGGASGPVEIGYALETLEGMPLGPMIFIPIELQPRTALGIEAGLLPESLLAGRGVEVPVTYTNRGNTPLDLLLEALARDPGYIARLAPDSLSLAPGAKATVTLHISAPRTELEARTFTVTLIARDQNNPDGAPLASRIVSSAVLPTANPATDLSIRIPGTFTTKLVGEDDELALGFELRGKGAIDESGTTLLDFRVRTPDTLDDSSLGQREDYRLRLDTPTTTWRFGHDAYQLSPLTTRRTDTPGAALDWHPGQNLLEAGAVVTLGLEQFDDHLIGGYVRQQLPDGPALKFNAALVDPARSDQGRATLYSLESIGPLSDTVTANLEYAQGTNDLLGSSWKQAWRGDIRYRDNGTELSYRTTHADPSFPGPFNDLDFQRWGLKLRPLDAVTVSGAWSTYARNLERDPVQFFTASREERWQGDVRWDLRGPWYTALGWEMFTREDRMPVPAFDTREEAGRVELGYQASDLWLNLQVRHGTLQDHLTDSSERGTDYRVNLAWRPEAGHRYEVYGGLSTLEGGTLLGGGRDYLGLSGAWELEDWRLRASYLGYDFTGMRPRHLQAEVAGTYTGAGGEEWQLIARLQESTGLERHIPYQLSYAIPLQIPVAKRKSVGVLTGQIVDAFGVGLPEVVLLLDSAAAVTNETGEFQFPPLPPGEYALTVDLNSLGLDQITEQELPLKVSLLAGDDTSQLLTVVPAASLSGRLLPPVPRNGTEAEGEERFAVTQGLLDPGALDNIYLELRQGDEVLRRVTTEGGKFLFERLRPGTWTLTVYPDQLPAGVEHPAAAIEIPLTAGEGATHNLQLEPKRRAIQMVPVG